MATDKSISIRQVKAAEETAAALAELRQRLEAIQAQLDRVEAALAQLPKPGKLETASRAAAKK